MAIEKSVEDGTEHRKVTLRLREGGIKEILTGIGPEGFCITGPGRVHRLDDQILFEFCFNVGTYETKIAALSIAIDIPLTEDELKFLPPEKKEEEPVEEPVVFVGTQVVVDDTQEIIDG